MMRCLGVSGQGPTLWERRDRTLVVFQQCVIRISVCWREVQSHTLGVVPASYESGCVYGTNEVAEFVCVCVFAHI